MIFTQAVFEINACPIYTLSLFLRSFSLFSNVLIIGRVEDKHICFSCAVHLCNSFGGRSFFISKYKRRILRFFVFFQFSFVPFSHFLSGSSKKILNWEKAREEIRHGTIEDNQDMTITRGQNDVCPQHYALYFCSPFSHGEGFV